MGDASLPTPSSSHHPPVATPPPSTIPRRDGCFTDSRMSQQYLLSSVIPPVCRPPPALSTSRSLHGCVGRHLAIKYMPIS
eukprot:3545197-Pyramimonas_sp.AAC.1